MTVDRCDFQVPPARPGWYGVVSGDAAGNTLHQAAFWNGSDWAKYPVRAYARSIRLCRRNRAPMIGRSRTDRSYADYFMLSALKEHLEQVTIDRTGRSWTENISMKSTFHNVFSLGGFALAVTLLPRTVLAQGLPIREASHEPLVLWVIGTAVLGLVLAYGIIHTRNRSAREKQITEQGTRDLYAREERDRRRK
jgi:hypothetical protein